MATIIEIDCEEIEIEDINNEESWVKALGSQIAEVASENYLYAYESLHDDIDDEKRVKFANQFFEVFNAFKKSWDAATPEARQQMSWREVVEDTITEGERFWGNQNDENAPVSFYSMKQDDIAFEMLCQCKKWKALERELKAAHESSGTDLDEDDLVNRIRNAVTEKMIDADPSSLLEGVGDIKIPVIFMPSPDPTASKTYTNDDFDLDVSGGLGSIAEAVIRGDAGPTSMMKVFNISPAELLEGIDLEEEDSDLIDSWVKLQDQLGIEPGNAKIHLPHLLECLSTTTSSYVTLCWYGMVEIKDLVKLDPINGFQLQGGGYGAFDFPNGDGYHLELPGNFRIDVNNPGYIGYFGRYQPDDKYDASVNAIGSPEPEKKKKFGLSEPSM
ncbi:hypothetical protein ACYPKM_03515 [Pseudomonas aeruginosa]